MIALPATVPYTFISLCAGIGGFDLAFEHAGFKPVCQVENDPFCISILEKHWPNVYRIEDMNEAAAHPEILPSADVVFGGVECQPFSYAGKRRGKLDDRYLWPQTFAIVRAVQPRVVFVENVPGIVNLALDTILADLEGDGYTCWTFNIPACAVGAVHIRKRIFIVGYAASRGKRDQQISERTSFVLGQPERSGEFSNGVFNPGYSGGARRTETKEQEHGQTVGLPGSIRTGVSVGNADAAGPQGKTREELSKSIASSRRVRVSNSDTTRLSFRSGFTQPSRRPVDSLGANLSDSNGKPPIGTAITREECVPGPVESGMVRDADGFSHRLDQPRWPAPYGAEQYDYEPSRTVKGYRGRAARIKALGNAVVPQVVIPFAQTIRQILEAEDRQRDQGSVNQRKVNQ